jgi:hypothetical protein
MRRASRLSGAMLISANGSSVFSDLSGGAKSRSRRAGSYGMCRSPFVWQRPFANIGICGQRGCCVNATDYRSRRTLCAIMSVGRLDGHRSWSVARTAFATRLFAPGDARGPGASDSRARRASGSDHDAAVHAPQSRGARSRDPVARVLRNPPESWRHVGDSEW